MIDLKNTAKGPRAILLKDTTYVFIQPGQTASVDEDRIEGIPDGVEKVGESAAVDAKGDEPNGAETGKPLADLRRDELEAVAAGEGIDIEKIEGTGSDGNVLVDDIRKAIEAKRAASGN